MMRDGRFIDVGRRDPHLVGPGEVALFRGSVPWQYRITDKRTVPPSRGSVPPAFFGPMNPHDWPHVMIVFRPQHDYKDVHRY